MVSGASALIGIGSNLGNRVENCIKALTLLAQQDRVKLLAFSSLFLTQPLGRQNQPWFVNGVARIETRLSPLQLFGLLVHLERQLGRTRPFRHAPRTMDLDFLLVDNQIILHPGLKVPHPEFRERRFVLEPLAEVAPDWPDPVTGLQVKELLKRCPDKSRLRLLLPCYQVEEAIKGSGVAFC